MRKIKRRKNKDDYILIDANALAYSALYTTGGLSYRGTPTGIIFGFLKSLIQIAKNLKSPNLIFCWDSHKSFRLINYKNYKKSRHNKYKELSPEEQQDHADFIDQRKQLADTILSRIGLKNSFTAEGFEGDDLIGQLVNQLKGKKIIVTDDNDLFQLLDRSDIFLLRKKKMFTKKDFKKKYGIHPDQWVMAKAIGGCNGDDIKGIKGIGDSKNPSSKSLKYITGQLKWGKVYDRINSNKGQRIISRNIPLVTVPYLSHLMPPMVIKKNTVTRKKLLRLFDQYRMVSLMEKENFKKWEQVFDL